MSGFLTNDFVMGVRGYHVYRKDWSPYVGEHLDLVQDKDNKCDCCAVALIKRLLMVLE